MLQRAVLVAGLMLLACALCSCQILSYNASHEEGVWPTLEVRARQTKQNQLVVDWVFSNTLPYSVWIPVAWGHNSPREVRLPMGVFLPNGDLLLVFGDCRHSEAELELHTFLWSAGVDLKRVDGGQSLSGEVVLEIPYKLQRDLMSPYEFEPRDALSQGIIVASFNSASGIQLAMEFWLDEPNSLSKGDPRNQIMVRSLAWAVIQGRQDYGISEQANAQIVLSRRLAISVPLQESLKLFYLWPGKEVPSPWKRAYEN